MDVVYILGTGSCFNDLELKMSLRSIDKNITGIRNVYLVGTKPNFEFQNIIYVPAKDISPIPDNNIAHKITIACNIKELSSNFLFINDDHYIIQKTSIKFPYYYSGKLDKSREDPYGKRKTNTLNHLKSINKPFKYFDVHTPIVYNKKLFLKHVTNQWDNKTPMVVKSLYANSLDIEGAELREDVKRMTFDPDLPFISSFPRMTSAFVRSLTQLFPNKSRFEI